MHAVSMSCIDAVSEDLDLILLLAAAVLRRQPAEKLLERLWCGAGAGARAAVGRRLRGDDRKAVRPCNFRDGICRRCTRNAEACHSPVHTLEMQCSLSAESHRCVERSVRDVVRALQFVGHQKMFSEASGGPHR